MYAHVSATCFLHAKCDRIWTVVTERIRLGLLREKPKLRRVALYDMELGTLLQSVKVLWHIKPILSKCSRLLLQSPFHLDHFDRLSAVSSSATFQQSSALHLSAWHAAEDRMNEAIHVVEPLSNTMKI